MWLEEKVFSFKTENNIVSEDFLSKILLKVNGNLTNVRLPDLFIKITDDAEFDDDDKILELKGYSILEFTENGIFKSKVGDVNLSFHSEEAGEVTINLIENPWFQKGDKEVTQETFDNFEKKIIELASVKKEEVQGEGLGSPHSNPSLLNKKYDNNKVRLINNGYKEYSFGNFKLLKKNDSLLLFEILDEDTVYKIDSEPKSITENVWMFDDEYNLRSLNVKLIDDKLVIEPIHKEFTD